MNAKRVLLVIGIALVGFGLAGCKKKTEPTASAKSPSMENTAKKATTAAAEDAKKTTAAAAETTEQTMCPVMDGNKIDKNVFVEYKGKKVYFCCTACKAKFEADPEKYVANLPQFKQ